MITFKNVHLSRRGKTLFSDVSMTIYAGQHIGLTGENGCGKSSFFSLVLGEIYGDSGDIHIPRSLRIAHMAQEVKALERPAIEYVLDGDETLRSIERKIETATTRGDNDALATLYEALETHDGYTARARAEQLLHGLGFRQDQLQDSVSAFSGGWRMRLNLARTLMSPSDLLLLDEPTNHLDLEAILWLESWLKQYPGTLICISHDRTFLDSIASHIAHMEKNEITLYSGNYTAFEKIRAEKLLTQQATYEKQQRKKAHLQGFIDRFRAKASKARQAQSRLKALEKMEMLSPAHAHSPFSFTFHTGDKISDPLISVNEGVIGYDGKPLIKNINISFHPDSRIGLLGPNGNGKSSFIKAIAGKMDLLSGNITRGEHLAIGYFAQHQIESLDLQASACLHLQRLSPAVREQEIRDFLGRYNFYGDKVLEPVEGFSGGEQARLALAIIAWQRPNLLLLDEPTNHLDLEMRYALTMALQNFEGAVVLVSHDRSLMEAVSSEFWLVNDFAIEPFDGDLNTYAKWYREHERNKNKKTTTGDQRNNVRPENQKQLKIQYEKKCRELKKNITEIEKNLSVAGREHQQINKELENPELYEKGETEKLKTLLKQQTVLQQKIETLEEKWVTASEAMEQALSSGL